MKHKNEPALNNFFTIHVPSASLLHENRQRKPFPLPESSNPFMNQKLQKLKSNRDQHIACLYKTTPHKVMKSSKKIETNPLIKNLSSRTFQKVGIIKRTDDPVYQIVLPKKENINDQLMAKYVPNEQPRELLTTQKTKRTHRYSSTGTRNMRRTVSNMSDLRTNSPVKIDKFNWVGEMGHSKELQISGFKAPTSETIDHLRRGVEGSHFYQKKFFI